MIKAIIIPSIVSGLQRSVEVRVGHVFSIGQSYLRFLEEHLNCFANGIAIVDTIREDHPEPIGLKITFRDIQTQELGETVMWFSIERFIESFLQSEQSDMSRIIDIGSEVYIGRRIKFKGKDLFGKKGKVIATIASPSGMEFFIELEENIGGSCCDGLGKHGHCITIKKTGVCDKKELMKREITFREFKPTNSPSHKLPAFPPAKLYTTLQYN